MRKERSSSSGSCAGAPALIEWMCASACVHLSLEEGATITCNDGRLWLPPHSTLRILSRLISFSILLLLLLIVIGILQFRPPNNRTEPPPRVNQGNAIPTLLLVAQMLIFSR